MINRHSLNKLVLSIAMLCMALLLSAQINFPTGSSYRYLKGSEAANLNAGWMNSTFGDSQWHNGNAPFRFGDGTGGTELTDMQNSYSVLYLRSNFSASNVDGIDALEFSVDYDDGFVIWINGERVLDVYAPAVLSHDAFASDLHESGVQETFQIDAGSANLVEGDNTLAIQAFNYSLTSSDFFIDVSLNAGIPDPIFQDSVGLQFSAASGFYDQAFSLNITPANPAWNVYYTLDGSNPQSSESTLVSTGSATIQINPNSTTNRDATPAVMVRASAGTTGIIPSFPEVRTFIFPEEVIAQSYPGGDWPDYNVNGQIIDLDMDSRIANHATYKNLLIPALKDIPSLSIATDIDHLFDSETGIYVNAWGHGYEWEKECNVELIQPDDSEGFNANAGLRIRGGWSRHNDFPKHSFRLFFRSEYGDSKLDFPLFGDEGTDKYDKIDIRTSQNYAWAQGDSRNTMLREIFSRDTQRDMGRPYTRSRYYHLYLNGMYWGLFQTQERSEARFAADYLGGDAEDYDVIKVNTEDWNYRIEATDGDFVLWNEIWEMCQTGFSSNADYYHVQGLDADGNHVPGKQVYVDIDNLIDYMLSIFYTGNFDAPTSSFGGNNGPNNFFAIKSRENKSQGFTFFNHDAEHSLFSDAASPGIGLNEDRVNLSMNVSNFSAFHPQWLHDKLTQNEEYRFRFMDRSNELLTGNGLLTPDRNLERLNSRAEEMESAIIAESARWGDSKRGSSDPYTRDDTWIPEVNKVRDDFIPYRSDILVEQLKNGGLYSEMEAPEVYKNGILLEDKRVAVSGSSTLQIKNPNSSSTIYYTIDGSDPRVPGGGKAPTAISGGSSQVDVSFTGSAILKTRVHFGGKWSAMKEVNLISANEDYSKLVITELHYHPEELVILDDTTGSKDMEFIEFKNTGSSAVSLAGLVLDSAVYYEFPAEAILAPGQFHVVAAKPSKFYLRYGLQASGNFKKNFSNGGEEVLLSDPLGNDLIRFFYSDDPPWPTEADGDGFSLTSAIKNPTGFPGDAAYWKRSYHKGGSPFADEPFDVSNEADMLSAEDISVYPNPTSDLLNVQLPLSITSAATLSLYGIKGNLIHQEIIYGSSTIQLSGLNLSSGIYLVKLRTENQVFTRKIIYRQAN